MKVDPTNPPRLDKAVRAPKQQTAPASAAWLAWARLFAVPLLVAACTQLYGLLAYLFTIGLQHAGALFGDERTIFEASARFTGLAVGGLLATLLIALPCLRFRARRGRDGLSTWLLAWGLAYLPLLVIWLLQGHDRAMALRGAAALAAALFSVVLLWWWLFYASASAAPGARTRSSHQTPG